MKYLMILPLALLLSISSFAQDYSGTYTLNTGSGQIILVLEKNESGIYNGSLSGNNTVIKITGQVLNGLLSGRAGDENSPVVFVAGIQNQVLTLTMAEVDLYGNINPATSQVLSFIRSDKSPPSIAQNSGDVIINNTVLSKEQIREIATRYGVEPKAGNYWYDPVSGLYGVSGYPSYGFMFPGHNFGVLQKNASSGNTGVLINGRELPQLEWAVLSYVIGYYIQPGSYWLDSNGNVGYEGNKNPVLNLFVLARQNNYNGKGVGGDNFWSSRFSAGNSNQDNSQGYVSVPGYGPVGYGF
jgi:hypothetical protein